jgi:hypothetical protein
VYKTCFAVTRNKSSDAHNKNPDPLEFPKDIKTADARLLSGTFRILYYSGVVKC